MNIPEDLLYSKEHEWVRIDGSKAQVGITDYAQHSLGDIVFVELPEVDSEVEAMSEAGIVESVKAVSPIYSPVSGKIIAVNEKLESTPELLNKTPYEEWIFEVEITNTEEQKDLLDGAAYKKFCELQK
ncbi:MAG: glycine cleavage system protein GcvH [Planctomycetia bacterium]|nr:glycine cleavage system protein GcvH [Planctomycetia bacterium]